MKEDRVSIHIATLDRHTELTLLLQSLRTQTYQNWDLVILDQSGAPVSDCYFAMSLLNRIKLEGHHVNLIRQEQAKGVCQARNRLLNDDYFKSNSHVLRIDDDTVLEPDYIERLFKVLDAGYDIASGITPLLAHPELMRDTKHVKPIINRKVFDKEGNIIKYGDDCGYAFVQAEIIPSHEFRSCSLFTRKVFEGIRYETNLSPTGFREECFYSFRAIAKGFTIGVHTGAVAYHLNTPSGGCKSSNYQERVMSDDKYFRKWVKEMYLTNEDFKKRIVRTGSKKSKFSK